jgi:hypothetical protein
MTAMIRPGGDVTIPRISSSFLLPTLHPLDEQSAHDKLSEVFRFHRSALMPKAENVYARYITDALSAFALGVGNIAQPTRGQTYKRHQD